MTLRHSLFVLLAVGLTATALPAAPGMADAPGDKINCQSPVASLSSDFPGGQMAACQVSVDGKFLITLLPEDEPPINNSPWYAFEVSPGKEPRDILVQLHYPHYGHRYVPKISMDGQTWTSLPKSSYVIKGEDRKLVELTLPAAEKPYRVAAQEILVARDYDQWMAFLSAADFVNLATIGNSREGRPIKKLSTRMEAGRKCAPHVYLVGRQHPPEVTGALGMLPFVEEILGDSDLANRFRAAYNLTIVPLLNPDGVERGYWRHNTDHTDLNRDWGPFKQPETQLVKAELDELAKCKDDGLALFLDFHSTAKNLFYTQDDAEMTRPANFAEKWLEASRGKLPDYHFSQEKRHNSGSPTSKNYVYSRFGVPAITYEVGDETDRDQIRISAGVFAREMMVLLLRETGDQARSHQQ